MNQYILVVIQGRMQSKRFPGKMLAPFQGKPLVWHIVTTLRTLFDARQLVLATSEGAADDPLALYGEQHCGIRVYRGEKERVFRRLQGCLRQYPCEWFFRVCGDSPFLEMDLFAQALERVKECPEADVVTNCFPYTYPRGQSVELFKVSTFMEVQVGILTAEEQEHVGPYFYHRPEQFKIVNIVNPQGNESSVNLCIDTVDDLHHLEKACA